MTHQIELKQFQGWLEKNHFFTYAESTKDQKVLCATIRGVFEVHHKGVKVWAGMQPSQAVEQYNKI